MYEIKRAKRWSQTLIHFVTARACLFAVTCEITFGQNVCELMFRVNVPNLNLGVQINPIKQPLQNHSMGP